MAACIAERVFGSTHKIQSAGAEAGSGVQAAGNAIKALKEMGLDLSGHRSVDVRNLDVCSFDLIIIFRPSSAELLSIPHSAAVSYVDLEDPHGESLDTYRVAAKSIQRAVRRLHTEDALRRADDSNGPKGSHLEGIVIRATREFEAEIAEFSSKGLGISVRKKATLGELKEAIKEFGTNNKRPDLLHLADTLSEVNEVWTKIKHVKQLRKDPKREDLIATLHAIQKTYTLLDQIAVPVEGDP
jgi:protein-tyrosine-phosphatase